MILFTVLVTLVAGSFGQLEGFKRHLDYNTTTSLAECVDCIADSSKKICSLSELNTTSHCCDINDTSSVCGGNTNYE